MAFTLLRPVRDVLYANPHDSAARALTANESHRWPRLSPSGRRMASVVLRSATDEYLARHEPRQRRDAARQRRPGDVSVLDRRGCARLSRRGRSGRNPKFAASISNRGRTPPSRACPRSVSWLAIRPGASEAAFVVAAAEGEQIVLRSLTSDRESVIASGGELEQLRWRPDGQVLAWSGPRVAGDAATHGVHVVEPGRGAPRRVIADGYAPTWNAHGDLFFVRYAGDGDRAGIWHVDRKTNAEVQDRRVTRIDYFDVAGASLVFARDTARAQVFAMPLKTSRVRD